MLLNPPLFLLFVLPSSLFLLLPVQLHFPYLPPSRLIDCPSPSGKENYFPSPPTYGRSRPSDSQPPLRVLRLRGAMVVGDTAALREQAYYKGGLYRAWGSNYHSRQDSLVLFPRGKMRTKYWDVYRALTPERKRYLCLPPEQAAKELFEYICSQNHLCGLNASPV